MRKKRNSSGYLIRPSPVVNTVGLKTPITRYLNLMTIFMEDTQYNYPHVPHPL
jgi:hypothetical protein